MSSSPSTTELPLFGYNSKLIPDIDFCQKDASVIESQVITNYEKYFTSITKLAKTLGRADPVRLFLLTNIYQLVVQRSIADSTGKQNLLKYAVGANLQNIGAKWGPRGLKIAATNAATTLQFSLSYPLAVDVLIQKGIIAQSNSGIRFKTDVDVTIPATQLTVTVKATCEQAGVIGNDLVPGQINDLVNWNQPFLVGVTNTVTSSGGSEEESDEHYRARIWMAPESLPTTGPVEGYEYWAASANSDIIDVSVWSAPEVAGQVFVYPLMVRGQLPTQAVLDQVYASCNADKRRPLTDWLHVQAPAAINYPPLVSYWIKTSDSMFAADIEESVGNAYNEYVMWQRSKIGRDINPSECDKKLVAAGAKRTDIPGSTTFVFTVVDSQSVANEAGGGLTYIGLEDE